MTTHVARELAHLREAFPGWTFRFDSFDRSWSATSPAARMESRELGSVSGSVSVTAASPEDVATMIHGLRGQLLVVP